MKQRDYKNFKTLNMFYMNHLQQTLDRNYKWFYIIKYGFKLANAGIVANIIRCFPKLLSSLMILFIWSKANSSVAIFTYLVVGRIYKSFCEGFGEQVVSQDIISGSLTSEILRPNDYFPVRIFAYTGRRILRNFLECITFVITALLSINFFSPIPFTGLSNILILIVIIPISFFINFVLGYLVGVLAFFIKDKREFDSISSSWDVTKTILYGLIVPLDQLPFKEFFEFLPTSYFVHHPMQIYLGKYSQIQIIQTFFAGFVWCFVLWILARTVFKFGLKRNEAVGL
jgi:ABC-2 type transport system permease protein